MLCNFIEITLWHGCSPVNLLHISEHLFLRTLPDGCFCEYHVTDALTEEPSALCTEPSAEPQLIDDAFLFGGKRVPYRIKKCNSNHYCKIYIKAIVPVLTETTK